MKKLSKEEMKNVVGGVQVIVDCCPEGKKLAHCFWRHGACIDQDWGRCPAGDHTCQEYCA